MLKRVYFYWLVLAICAFPTAALSSGSSDPIRDVNYLPATPSFCAENTKIGGGASYKDTSEYLGSRNKKVSFMLRGNPKIWNVRLVAQDGITDDPVNDSIHFVERGKTAEQIVRRGDITWMRPNWISTGMSTLRTVAEVGVTGLGLFHTAFAYAIRPLRSIGWVGNVEVVGGLTTDAKRAKEMGQKLSDFDTFLAKYGFNIPAETMLFVGRQTLLPNTYGSAGWIAPINNIWRGDFLPNIVSLNPSFYNTDYLWNPSVLYSVRASQVIVKQSKGKAFSLSTVFRTGFASYIAAIYQDDPKILFSDKRAYDISQKTDVIRSTSFPSFGDLTTSYMQSSVLTSNVLWRLSKTIGRENALRRTQALLYSLDMYYPSYKSIKEKFSYPVKGFGLYAPQNTVYSLEYLLAVLLREGESWSEAHLVKELIQEISTEMGFTFEQISRVANYLHGSNSLKFRKLSAEYDGADKFMGATTSVIGAAIEIGSIWWIISTIF